jgi:hypothetical protein
MDARDYVNNQCLKAVAFMESHVRTSPAVQQLAGLYRQADQGGLVTVITIGFAFNEFSEALTQAGHHVIATGLEQSLQHHVDDPSMQWVTDKLVNEPRDQAEDIALDAAKDFLLAEGHGVLAEQEEVRRQQEVDLRDPAKLEAEKQEGAQLEAQWEARRKADELAEQSRQQEAEQKQADRLFEAVRKDQESRPQQQADKDTHEAPAQAQEKGDGPSGAEARKVQDEQEKARAEQAAQVKELRDQLAKKYEGSAEREKYLKEFERAAKEAADALARQQAAELQRMQQQPPQR